MCGIIGIISKEESLLINDVIIALEQLINRGYDSSGYSFYLNEWITIKKASTNNLNSIEYLKKQPKKLKINSIIGHNRWSTTGIVNDINSHPHLSYNNEISLVHNGIIENYLELKNPNIKYISQTDSEVLASYIIDNPLNSIQGTYAIAYINKNNKNKLYFAKNGSPLLIGFSKDKNYWMVVSEQSAFNDKINYYQVIDDGYAGYIDIDNQTVFPLIDTKINVFSYNEISNSPLPYNYWLIKEINDQPSSVNNLLKSRIINNEIIFPEISSFNYENIIILGCGTSLHAGHFISNNFRKSKQFKSVQVIDGSDFEEYHISNNSIIILLSQSGETKDLHRCIKIAKENNVKTLGIVNVEGSMIAREVDIVLYLHAGKEKSVASTKSFTNQVIMLYLLDLWIRKEKYDMEYLSKEIYSVINYVNEPIKKMAKLIFKKNNMFILGKSDNEWIAKEASLKIKEVSYIHAEGFSSSSLKHGPFALLEEDTPVIIIAPNDEYYTKNMNAYLEVKSRKANAILIDEKFINYSGKYKNLMMIIPLQLLAYYLSIERGINPDYPRNLAKVVTVE